MTTIPPDTLKLALANKHNQVRRIGDVSGTEPFKVRLKEAICYIANAYCGADIGANDAAFQECANTFLSQFRSMAVPEIKAAFQMAAGGKLNDVNLNAYWGRFPVSMFSEVCRKYIAVRDAAFAAYDKEVEKIEHEKMEERRAEENAKAREAIIVDWQERKMDNRPFDKWQDVPYGYGEVLRAEGMIYDNNDLWREVKRDVVATFMADVKMGRNWMGVGDIYLCRRIYEKVRNFPDIFPTELEPRAKTDYFKKLAFKSLSND